MVFRRTFPRGTGKWFATPGFHPSINKNIQQVQNWAQKIIKFYKKYYFVDWVRFQFIGIVSNSTMDQRSNAEVLANFCSCISGFTRSSCELSHQSVLSRSCRFISPSFGLRRPLSYRNAPSEKKFSKLHFFEFHFYYSTNAIISFASSNT